jgi:hypothetical protein
MRRSSKTAANRFADHQPRPSQKRASLQYPCAGAFQVHRSWAKPLLLYDIRINSGAPFDCDSLTFCHNRHGPARATAMATLTLTRNDDKTTMTTMSNFVMLHCLSVHCNAFIHHIPIPRRNHKRQPHIQASFPPNQKNFSPPSCNPPLSLPLASLPPQPFSRDKKHHARSS